METQYPDGFTGVQLSPQEAHEIAACASVFAFVQERVPLREGVVRLGGMFGGDENSYRVSFDEEESTGGGESPSFSCVARVEGFGENSATTTGATTVQVVEQLGPPQDYLVRFLVNGKPRVMQVLSQSVTGEWYMEMHGANLPVLVQSPREFELSRHMLPPKKIDTSDMVLSPMPGVLIGLAVMEGDHVEIGQELCIVEAMKMQNIIRAPRAGIIAKCRVEPGASLMADDVILDYEPVTITEDGENNT
uniref:propionyl-CoA carboxylase n=1 Tax=Cyclophora tenuis TaxID=216820 RepID=A0A7S1D1I0_CYCTE